jgi:hypothetical protein
LRKKAPAAESLVPPAGAEAGARADVAARRDFVIER